MRYICADTTLLVLGVWYDSMTNCQLGETDNGMRNEVYTVKPYLHVR